ncbi:DoxX family membrane protein [Patescibacteria group bacterium]|nr:DoxX family membrane protein [Patescibacteria group bacterium]
MKTYGFHILRVGMAITFLWIGVLIFQSPEAWAGFIQPWARDLLPISPRTALIATAIFDLTIGGFLLIDVFTWLASLLGAIHLASILAVSGIDAITVRDIGLLSAMIFLSVTSWPHRFSFKKLL